MDPVRALGPLVREMTRRKRAPRHSRLRLSTSIVDSCPASPDIRSLYTGPLGEAVSRSVRSRRRCRHATVCHAGGTQSPHCECLKVKTRPLDLIRKDETRKRPAPLLFFNIARGGEFKHGEPRHKRTRLWEVVWN